MKTHEDAIVACGARRVFCYLPDDKVWYELPEMTDSFNSIHYSVCVCHGKLYVIGEKSVVINRRIVTNVFVEYFDPVLGLWIKLDIPDELAYSSATVTMQGCLYFVGGSRNQLRDVGKYNPDTNQWHKVCPLSSPRSGVCTGTDGSYLYAIGGIDQTEQYLNIVERFDPRKNTWENLPPMLARRAIAGGAVIKQRLFVFGGLHREDSRDDDSCEMFDLATKMWSSISSQVIRRQPTSAVSFKGKIYVFTANTASSEPEKFQVYDADQNQWEPCTFPVDTYELYKLSCLRVSKNALSKYRKVSK